MTRTSQAAPASTLCHVAEQEIAECRLTALTQHDEIGAQTGLLVQRQHGGIAMIDPDLRTGDADAVQQGMQPSQGRCALPAAMLANDRRRYVASQQSVLARNVQRVDEMQRRRRAQHARPAQHRLGLACGSDRNQRLPVGRVDRLLGHQHRPPHQPQQPLRGRAEHQAPQWIDASGSDHEHVGIIGHAADEVQRVAHLDALGDVNVMSAADLRCLTAQGRLRERDLVVDDHCGRPRAQPLQACRVDDVQQGQACVVMSGNQRCAMHGVVGRFREVGGDENGSEKGHESLRRKGALPACHRQAGTRHE